MTSLLLAGCEDTIVAQCTPHGRGALALLRLSGARAHEIGRAVASAWPSRARVATLSALRTSEGILLDRAIIVRYDAPASFTGEDAVEISTHGGHIVPVSIMAALIEQGARQALPGEFTRRAVLNGKLDILQAEAIGDLVAARSRAAQRVALGQMDGRLSTHVEALREQVIAVEALLAYDIDFPEEDSGPVPATAVLDAVERATASLQELLATYRGGELIREGALVVIGGPPNVGKSTLFNALVGQSRAIVTPLPGTTRDAIEAVVETAHWPLRLVDTAGLRLTADLVEQLGVQKSEDYLRAASVILACGDDPDTLSSAVEQARALSGAAILAVRTKADLEPGVDPETALRATQGAAVRTIPVSAHTGAGLSDLVVAIDDVLTSAAGVPNESAPLLTQARHRSDVSRALGELSAFREAWHELRVPATVAGTHLRAAVSALEDLIGTVDVEDVLNRVFRTFCVGK